MTVKPHHFGLAIALHVILFFFVLVGVQCSRPVETPPVMQGVIINAKDLKTPKLPTPPTPNPPKPQDIDQGQQQIVKDTDVVAEQAKQKQEQAQAEQKIAEQKADEQRQKEAQAKAEQEQKQAEAAKAEELKRQQEAQRQAEEKAAEQKKQQDEAKRKADEAAAAEAQRQKDLQEQVRKEAQERQEAQAAAIAKQKKAEAAQHEADLRKRREELERSLGAATTEMTAQVQSQWIVQLTAAIQNAWAWPPGTDPKTKATLKIRLAPNGQVLSADIVSSSGIPLFDQTLKQAAYKASPLPLPQDPSAFDPNITACFSPNSRSCQ